MSSLSEKFNARERICLSDKRGIVKTEKGTAEVFKIFLVILYRILTFPSILILILLQKISKNLP